MDAQRLEQILSDFAAFMWGPPMIVLLVGGGFFFLIFSRLTPYRHFPHALRVLRGDFDDPEDEGDIPHFQALSTALSGTLGMGNVAGVAVAISLGGPGAVFWMWLTAVVGVATKFFTATLAVMYRGEDSRGVLQGGPMYVIREALGRRWMPLAWLFAFAALIGTTPVFQVNQLVQLVREVVAVPAGLASPDDHFLFDLLFGLTLAVLVFVVIIGHIKRVGAVTGRLVPTMVVIYLAFTVFILIRHYDRIPDAMALIVTDAFTGAAAAGGAVGTVIAMGIRRGAFSNEAGIGTESLAHSAARTNQPVREGMVAMLGPVVDTLIVCSCTALAIIVTGAWKIEDIDGITLTSRAFESAMPGSGSYLLTLMVLMLGISTILSFWYYGTKCLGFLIGAEHQHHYVWIYCALVVIGAVMSLEMVVGFVDGMYATMAIPTMVTTLVLAPRVTRATRDYLHRHGLDGRGAGGRKRH